MIRYAPRIRKTVPKGKTLAEHLSHLYDVAYPGQQGSALEWYPIELRLALPDRILNDKMVTDEMLFEYWKDYKIKERKLSVLYVALEKAEDRVGEMAEAYNTALSAKYLDDAVEKFDNAKTQYNLSIEAVANIRKKIIAIEEKIRIRANDEPEF